MVVYEDNFNIKFKEKTYIALGSFDGLHIGHMSLVNKTIELARDNNAKSMLFTFKNHPLTIINENIAPKLIMNNKTKTKLLEKSGIDIINYAEFNEAFMKISPEDFIKNMLEHYNVEGIIVGFNYRFGYKNLGDVELLKKLSIKLGFNLNIINPVKINNEIVNSSTIRNLIADGEILTANYFLTRSFMLSGQVVHGKQLGRKIQFPTVNLEYDKKFVLPCGGVYYTSVEYDNKYYKGVTNIGYNPTVNDKKLSIETHILNFNKSIYGENIKIYFHERIRDEKKFDSVAELSKQLAKDTEYARIQSLSVEKQFTF